LELIIGNLLLLGDNGSVVVQLLTYDVPAIRLFDLTAPVIFSPGTVPSGYYDILQFDFILHSSSIGGSLDEYSESWTSSTVTFPKPSDIPTASRLRSLPGTNFSGDKVSSRLGNFDPNVVELMLNQDYHPNQVTTTTIWPFNSIFYWGNTLKMLTPQETHYMDEIVSTYPHEEHSHGYLNGLIIPFEGITIPSNAEAVRFEVAWDLTGLIERYTGMTASPADDIFILKNKWWEGFSIDAVIE
jgi:hypothetical protein